VELGVAEGLKQTSCVNLCNIYTISQRELKGFVGTVSREKMREVCRAFAIACACE
jgi:mRNA-degrading endonuclease toxin of MazEF toxin-antitoxin module